MGHKRMVMSQVSWSPWDRMPNEGPWLRAGRNSRASQNKVKAGLFREIHIPIDRIQSVSESESSPGRNTVHRESVGHLRR